MYYTIQDPTYKEYTVYVVCTLTVYMCWWNEFITRSRGKRMYTILNPFWNLYQTSNDHDISRSRPSWTL